jgi:pimeloyl-CoA synthetase
MDFMSISLQKIKEIKVLLFWIFYIQIYHDFMAISLQKIKEIKAYIYIYIYIYISTERERERDFISWGQNQISDFVY